MIGAAGGDRRGRQSAALIVSSPGGGYGGGSALVTWASIENFEERLVPGRIDPLVLAQLRSATSLANAPSSTPSTGES